MSDHYAAVVVGSGYGGAITASRLARAGQRVCLLERGRELHPGEYPRTPEEGVSQMHVANGPGPPGDRRNLLSFRLSHDVDVFSGCGLGGTSLVNANVSLRPSDAVLDDPRWPAELRTDRGGLDAGFEHAREMLCPETYPTWFPALGKVAALRQSAGSDTFELTPINVTFRSGPNHVGVHQEACIGCGDCVTGCNHWAKNTLLMNYLPDAAKHDAEIFTEVEVDRVERVGDRWVVWYQPLGEGQEVFRPGDESVTADIVVLAAGTFGSNEILLRSAHHGLSVSKCLGKRFTGNGDVLGYAYGLRMDVNGSGMGARVPDPDHPPGPCITSMIDDRTQGQLIIQDATIPGGLAPAVPAMLLSQLLRSWVRGGVRYHSGPLGFLQSALTAGRRGAMRRMQTFLLIGADDDGGELVPDGEGGVRVRWPQAGQRSFYARANERLKEAAASSHGIFLHSPIYSKFFGYDLMTVHPLGGCVMADDASEGVVDGRSQVFSGAAGTDVHPGLYVSDGAVVPLPLQVNPLLTISALAERAVALMAADRGWTIDYSLPPPGPGDRGPSPVDDGTPPPLPPTKPGLRFSEKMSGGFSLGDGGVDDTGLTDLDTYRDAARRGEAAGSRLTFVLTLSTDDAREVIAHIDAPMVANGTVDASALSPEPLTVRGGRFNLFVADDPDPEIRHMWYRLPLEAADGTTYSFVGFKVIQPGNTTDAWGDTTTLYVTVRRGDDHGPVVGRGVLRIEPEDFAKQLGTMTITGPVGELERVELLAQFGEHFAGLLVHEYGHVVQRTSLLKRHTPPRKHRPLRVPPPSVHTYRSRDGLNLRLTRYQGGPRGPVVISHGHGANPLTFTTDTIETNCLEYLVEHNFDVWVQEWRGSTLLPTSRGSFNADQVAHCDHPAAEQHIRATTGRHDLHWVTHCVGSMTVTMSTLAGAITPASLLVSTVATDPIGPPIMKLKADLNAAGWLRRLGVRYLTTDAYDDESVGAKAFDQLLRLYPIPKSERCDQAVCRRLAFIYGCAVHHPAVDQRSHLLLHELFGTTNMEMMQHLASCAKKEKLIDARGQDVYMPRLEWLQLPMTFLHGQHGLVWVPESTKRSYARLIREFDPNLYRRVVLEHHGHQDTFMGARAVEDTFPAVLAHLDRAGA